MTSRLLGRCARLFPRASPRSAASAARFPSPVGGSTEPLWAQACLRPLASQLGDGKSVTREYDFHTEPKRTHLDDLVDKAVSPEDVLRAWVKKRGNANQAAHCIIKLTRLAQGDWGQTSSHPAEVLDDPRLQDMVEAIHGQMSSLWNNTLVSLLRALSALGMSSKAAVVGSVHTEALWRVRRLTYKQLAYLVDWGAGRKGQQETAIVTAALKQLELRWTEISDAKTVGVLMSKAGHLSPILMDRLEDKALELVEGFTVEDLSRVCVSMASQSRRSVPLLRAMSYHLLQKPSKELTSPLLLDLAFAYGKLNFQNSQVFQRMASELLPRMSELSSSDVTRCAKSLAFLKWLHHPLFEGFTEHYIANSEKYSTLQLCNLLMSLAKLGYQPSKGEEFFSKVHPALEGSLSDLEPFLQTDVVWALCALQQAKPQYLTALTHHTRLAKLSEGSPTRVENYRLKLLHILASLQLEHPGYSETTPSLAHLPQVSAPILRSPPSPLQTGLIATLESLVGGRDEALRTGVHTVYGWTIDGELVVDCENKPIDLVSLRAPHLPEGEGGQAIPEGARRLAFLAWEFPHFRSKSKDLLGRFAMMRRHLQLAGFITVEVPYYDWLELKSDRQKLSYLKDKIGKAVAEDMAK